MNAASPYDTLGVEQTAGKEAIRAAFKALAKRHHPDVAGGENETFSRIKAAYDLLMDDQARQRYDEFGVIPGDDASMLRLQAIQALLHLFEQLLKEVGVNTLEETDVIGLLETHIGTQVGRVDREVAEVKVTEQSYNKALDILQQRMTCGRGQKNIFTDVLEGKIGQARGVIAMKERERLLFQEMLRILQDYHFDFTLPRTFTIYTGNSCSTISFIVA